MRARRAAIVTAIAAFFVMAAPAVAATSAYPPNANDRNFNAGPGGWSAEDDVDPSLLCIPPLFCPELTSAHTPTGGVADSGHLRTSLDSLLGAAAVSTSLWTSPSFTYRGVDDEVPSEVGLELSRGAQVSELLEVLSNNVDYSVTLRNVSDGQDETVTPFTSLAGISSFSTAPTIDLDPSEIEVGKTYRIVITTRFDTGVQLLPGGWVGYDNIALTATTKSDGSGSGNGGDGGGQGGTGGAGGQGGGDGQAGGQGGQGGSGGAGGAGSKADAKKSTGAVSRKARLRGRNLVFRVKCKRRNGPCKPKFDGRVNRQGKKITNTKRARLKPGKAKRVKLRVKKRRHLSKIKKKGKITIRSRAKVGNKRAVRFKRVRVKARR